MIYEYYAKVNIRNEEIYCNSVTNLNDFKISTENVNGRRKITGFKFKFEYDEEIAFDKNFDYTLLNKLILHYLDFLSSVTSYPITKIYYETKIFDLNDKWITDINIQRLIPVRTDVNIDLTTYQHKLFDLSDQNIEDFRYYYAGILFYNSQLYEFSIREFFKIIEGDRSINNYDDYCIIRDLFSHNYEILDRASKRFRDNTNLKNKFISKEFTGKSNKQIIIIDRYNPNNIQSLLRMAKELKEIVESRILN